MPCANSSRAWVSACSCTNCANPVTWEVAEDQEQLVTDAAPSLAAPVDARIYEGVVARVHGPGDPLVYPVGKHYRTLDELERMRDQLDGTKVTFVLTHPEEHLDEGGVGDELGRVLDSRIEDGLLIARILVENDRGFAAIHDGIHELSLGYYRRLDENSYQRDIRIDHLALVPRARCGARCALRVTDCGTPQVDDIQHDPGEGQGCACKSLANAPGAGHNDLESHMPSQNDSAQGAKDQVAMDELQKQLDAAKARVAEVTAERDAAIARASDADKAKDAAEMDARNAKKDLEIVKKSVESAQKDAADAATRANAAEQSAKDAIAKVEQSVKDAVDTTFNDRVQARVELLAEATPILASVKNAEGEPLNLLKMSPRAIKVEVIKVVDGVDDAADLADETKKSEDFVNGIYHGALKRSDRAGASRTEVREAVQAMRDHGSKTVVANGDTVVNDARTKRAERLRSAWKNPSQDKE